MTFDEFILLTEPPTNLSPYLTALWHERHGDWNRAHDLVQDLATPEAALMHAYLHRREGDIANAQYWYRQAGRHGDLALPLDAEWEQHVRAWLNP